MSRIYFKPMQILLVGTKIYEIVGVYLGGEKTQNLIGISPIGEKFTSVEGIRTSEVLIPEEILLSLLQSNGGKLLDDADKAEYKLAITRNALHSIKLYAENKDSHVFTTADDALKHIAVME